MTQPAAPPASGNGTVIAAAALGLALIALESQLREQVNTEIQDALTTIAAAAVVAASTAPATVITGLGLIALPAFHGTLTTALNTAHDRVSAAVRSAYDAGAHVAQTKITADLAPLGYTVPSALPTLGTAADRIVADIDTMFGHAQTDIQNSVTAAYDGIHGDNPGPARVIAIRQAVLNAANRLSQRAKAAAAVAVYQGSTDAQQGIYAAYQNQTGHPGLMKRWLTTSNDPCGMCQALNGTMVGVNAEFDHNATTNDKDFRRVWRNLSGPPRHPNCRCQLELVAT